MEQKPQTTSKKVPVIFAVILVVLIAAAAATYALTRPPVQQGAKTVTIEVIVEDEVVNTHTLHTDEEYLGPLLIAEGIAEGETSEWGLFISKVDGREADGNAGEYWSISKGGVLADIGADAIAIADGDTYELSLVVWQG